MYDKVEDPHQDYDDTSPQMQRLIGELALMVIKDLDHLLIVSDQSKKSNNNDSTNQ